MTATPRWVLGPGAVAAGRDITAPVTITVLNGTFDRLRDAIFDPLPLRAALDLDRFTGRTELIAQIDRQIMYRRRGYVIIQAEAGMGKSALAAHLAFTRPCAHHFTRVEGARSPEQARRSLAAQLIGQWQLTDLAPGDAFPAGAGRPDWLLKVIRAAAAARDARDDGGPTWPLVLVVDGLDEADPPAPGQDTGIPLGLPRPENLPDGVFVVATTRFGIPLTAARGPVEWHTIVVAGEENLTDVRAYLDNAVNGRDPALAARLAEHDVSSATFVDQLAERCGGVWMYLRYVLDDIRAGRIRPSTLDGLPADLSSYYLEHLERWATRPAWPTVGLPVFATLAALRRPVGRVELAELAAVAPLAAGAWLDGDLRPFLDQHHDGARRTYAVRHQSLRDLFQPAPHDRDGATREILHDALTEAHHRIATTLIPQDRDWQSADPHFRDALPTHASHASLLDDLVLDPGFLLRVDPHALLRHADGVTTPDGRAAMAALELTIDQWTGLPDEDRLWWLHVWARKTRCAPLADRAAAAAERPWTVAAAMWAGPTHRTFTHHTEAVRAVCAVPLPGGHPLLASGGDDGTVWLWDPVTGDTGGRPLTESATSVWALCAVRTPTGTLLATAGNDDVIRLWDPIARQPVGDPLTGHDDAITALCEIPLPDGRRLLASASMDHTVRLWDLTSREAVGKPLVGHTGQAHAVCAVPMPDGRTLVASGGEDGTVRLWDPTTGQPASEPLTADNRRVLAVNAVRTASGRTLVAACSGGTARLWDPVPGRFVTQFTIGHPIVWAMCAVPMDTRTALAGASWDNKVWLVDPKSGKLIREPFTGHTDQVLAVCTLPMPGGRHLVASGSADGTVRLWDPSTEHGNRDGHTDSVRALCAMPRSDSRVVLLSGSDDASVRLWEPATGEPVYRFACAMGSMCLLPSGQVAVADHDGGVWLWDITNPRSIKAVTDYAGAMSSICAVLMPDGRIVVAGGTEDGTVRMWDPVTGEPVGKPFADHVRQVRAVCSLSLPDGRVLLAAGGVDLVTETVRLWDVKTRDKAGLLYADAAALCAVPLPDGQVLLAVAEHDVVRLWHPLTDKVVARLTGHKGTVRALCTLPMPDGRTLLVSGGADRSVRLWDPVGGLPVGQPLMGHTAAVLALCAVPTPDSTPLLASGGHDNTVLVWRLT